MGTHATTRIQSEDDYIESHTRWDGFSQEIKRDITILNKKWNACLTNMERKMKEKEYVSPYLEKWIKDFKELLIEVETTKDISKVMGLFCGQSLNHHHVLPTSEPKGGDLLKYWGKGHPDVLYMPTTDKFQKKAKLKSVEPKELPIDNTHFILRLIDVENNKLGYEAKSDKYLFNDVYVAGMTLEEVQELIFQLPYFMFEAHYAIRSTEKELDEEYEKNKYVSGMLFDKHQLKSFYSPSPEYDSRGHGYQSKESLLDRIDSLIPLDFSASALSTHLFVASAGKIRSLTVAETNWSKTIDNVERVYVQMSEGRRSLMAFKAANTEKLYESIKSRLLNVMKVNSDIKNISQEILCLGKDLTAIDYEKTLVNVFELLSIKPTPEDLLNAQKQKRNSMNW